MGKSKNISIRFDEEKTAFAFSETKIEKYQKLVDFFLEQFWWRHKMYSNPVLERLDNITEAAKNTELGKKVQSEIKKKPITLTVRDIKPNGEVQGTYILNQAPNYPIRKEGESGLDFKIRCSEYTSTNPSIED